jgi:hypothetical protein
MIKPKVGCKFILLIFFLLSFKFAKAQREVIEPILVQEIQPKKNLFITRPTVFFIYKRNLPFNLLNLKVSYWKNKGKFGISLNQAAFSENWSSGGVNSIALGGLLNYKGEYNKEGRNFTSEMILQYGKLKNSGQLERKTVDRLFLDSKDAQGNEIRKKISNFLAPGYLTESFGFEYKTAKSFSLRLGTGTARQTFIVDTTLYRNNPKNFGVPIGRKFRNELAFQAVANFDKDIMENLNLKSRYLLFASYEKLNNIDQRLDMTLTAKVNKLINVTVNGTALYDDDFSGEIQSSQSLALGIVFTMPR